LEQIVGGCLQGFFGIIILVSGWIATATDPTDSYLKEMIKAKEAK